MGDSMNLKHGLYGSKLYRLRFDIINRCENPKEHNYKYYGGRGIKVCREWKESPKAFLEWAMANGYKEGLEIDRIDVNGNYEPGNCHFITHKENCAIGKRRLRSDNSSGERNIVKTKFNTYEAYATINGKQKFIKTFKTIEEAIKARDSAEVIGNIFDKEGNDV